MHQDYQRVSPQWVLRVLGLLNSCSVSQSACSLIFRLNLLLGRSVLAVLFCTRGHCCSSCSRSSHSLWQPCRDWSMKLLPERDQIVVLMARGVIVQNEGLIMHDFPHCWTVQHNSWLIVVMKAVKLSLKSHKSGHWTMYEERGFFQIGCNSHTRQPWESQGALTTTLKYGSG